MFGSEKPNDRAQDHSVLKLGSKVRLSQDSRPELKLPLHKSSAAEDHMLSRSELMPAVLCHVIDT